MDAFILFFFKSNSFGLFGFFYLLNTHAFGFCKSFLFLSDPFNFCSFCFQANTFFFSCLCFETDTFFFSCLCLETDSLSSISFCSLFSFYLKSQLFSFLFIANTLTLRFLLVMYSFSLDCFFFETCFLLCIFFLFLSYPSFFLLYTNLFDLGIFFFLSNSLGLGCLCFDTYFFCFCFICLKLCILFFLLKMRFLYCGFFLLLHFFLFFITNLIMLFGLFVAFPFIFNFLLEINFFSLDCCFRQ